MSSSRRGDSPGGVLSFTYLDVLVCTMGSLVLMLVMFSERAKWAADKAAKETPPAPQSAEASPGDKAPDAAELTKRLADIRQQQQELEKARAEAQQRVHDEQQRVSHLEAHRRELEHALAKLHPVLEELEAAEKKQGVDQDQADKEVVRLREMLKDAEERVAGMRKEGAGPKSYAIVPYKGKNGTNRRPIYIECTKEAIIVQPEGVRLLASDFEGPLGSGNPLAAAIRAAQQELNARDAAAGNADAADAYPLFIVRPNGVNAYEVALSATRTWSSDYGYEFVEADWKLAYPEADPRLAAVMSHAVDKAREREELLAAAAPRRYAGRLTATPVPGRGGDGGGSGGGGGVAQSTGDFGDPAGGGGAGDGSTQFAGGDGASEPGLRNASSDSGAPGRASGEGRYGRRGPGGANSGGAAGDFADQFAAKQGGGAGTGHAVPGSSPSDQAGQRGPGGTAGSPGGNSLAAQGAGQSAGANAAANSGANASAGGASAAQQQSSSQAPSTNAFATSGAGYSSISGNQAPPAFDPHAAPGTSASDRAAAAGGSASSAADGSSSGGATASMNLSNKSDSAAKKRGANWANADASRHASPITRPIQLVVGQEQLALRDPNESPDPSSPQGAVVSFRQPTEKVLDQLALAIEQQTKQWGLAGEGMYWRPTLVFQVAPGAERHAQRLADLLQDSGVDLRLPGAGSSPASVPQTAARAEESNRATR